MKNTLSGLYLKAGVMLTMLLSSSAFAAEADVVSKGKDIMDLFFTESLAEAAGLVLVGLGGIFLLWAMWKLVFSKENPIDASKRWFLGGGFLLIIGIGILKVLSIIGITPAAG